VGCPDASIDRAARSSGLRFSTDYLGLSEARRISSTVAQRQRQRQRTQLGEMRIGGGRRPRRT